jgi:hypothetical protein
MSSLGGDRRFKLAAELCGALTNGALPPAIADHSLFKKGGKALEVRLSSPVRPSSVLHRLRGLIACHDSTSRCAAWIA